MKTAIAIALVEGLCLGACAKDKASSSSSRSARIVSAAAPGARAPCSTRSRRLAAGKWSVKGSDANMKGEIVFAVSSNDSIVRETMFPGTPHEMTNVYHLDGPLGGDDALLRDGKPQPRDAGDNRRQEPDRLPLRQRDEHDQARARCTDGRNDPDVQGQGPRDRDLPTHQGYGRWLLSPPMRLN